MLSFLSDYSLVDFSFISVFSTVVRSFTTSPAMINPATDGTYATLPGMSRRSVHLCAAPGGQMQFVLQLMDISSIGRFGSSSE